ncbi:MULTISPECIES: CpaD family pilus assembly protein [unclassified Sinorhizobium]|uniref:CpaD family pilus assembly protein n=1 Tax=unclassified Sinorhizobium TaxID=2613772 RepID=UPI00352598AA
MVSVPAKARQVSLSGLAVLAVITMGAGAISGCAAPRDSLVTGSIADDYRQRHPIVLAEAEHSVDIPVASTDRGLTTGLRDTVGGFAQDYKAHATGTIEILSPQGSYNSTAVVALRKQIRRQLVANGIPSPKIVDSFYSAGGAGDAAPIRLRFVATTAVTHNCGQWPEDLGENSFANRNWYNFGCASQNNLAAQVANPTDLIAPRAETPIDAQQRANVIDSYRTSQTTLSSGGFGGSGSGF